MPADTAPLRRDRQNAPAVAVTPIRIADAADAADSQDADALAQRADELEGQQQSDIESASIEAAYGTALAAQIEAKHDQVERVENRLEALIERGESRLQQIIATRPGILAGMVPGKRAQWQGEVQRRQAHLHTLHDRMEHVREIKEGMGLHAPRIEEMAARKLRAANPELAEDWDAMREAQRRHQALMRKRQQELREKALRREGEEQQRGARSQKLGISTSGA